MIMAPDSLKLSSPTSYGLIVNSPSVTSPPIFVGYTLYSPTAQIRRTREVREPPPFCQEVAKGFFFLMTRNFPAQTSFRPGGSLSHVGFSETCCPSP